MVDDGGRAVTLAQPARRIVSLAPSLTELLFAIGAGDRVVGRTAWCAYPPEALAVPDVGDGINPNLEAVLARRPDLVLLYQSPLNETAASQLERVGVAVLLLRQDRYDDVARHARLLGVATDQALAGDSIAALLDSLLAEPLPAPRVRVAFLAWENPPAVIGAGSYLDQLATHAGATNVFHDIAAASATVSLEIIAARDPDVLVVLADSVTAPLPGWARRPEWRAVRAVRDGRLWRLPAVLFGRPTPRAADAVRELRRRIGEWAP